MLSILPIVHVNERVQTLSGMDMPKSVWMVYLD